MKMFLWLAWIPLLLAGYQQKNKLGLKDHLKADQAALHDHATAFNGTPKILKTFWYYALMDVSRFKFTGRTAGAHTISRWAKPGLVIYQVKTELPGDTAYVEFVTGIDTVTKRSFNRPGRSIKLPPQKFIYHTYVIKPAGKSTLTYIRDNSEGLNECSIGNESYSVTREDIVLGKPELKLNEVLALTKE